MLSRGWSRNEHWTVAFAGGTRGFVKVASIEPSPQGLRDEVGVYERVQGPFMPRFLGWEDGEEPLLVVEDVSPGAAFPPPWDRRGIDAVLETLSEVARQRADLPSLAADPLLRWSEVAEDPEPFLSLGLVSREWLERMLPRLLEASEDAPLDGDSVVHCDVRSDNLCLRDGRAVLFDWNLARRGNPAFDVAFWLPSLTLEGGPDPRGFSESADGLAVVVAGFFAARAGLPPPIGAPRVRGFQLAQLEVALPWACAVLGLPLE